MPRICPKCFERFDDEALRCPTHGKPTVEDLSGQVVAERYELRELLGVGGMDSTVWMAWHAATHRNVALKLLPATHAAAAERFARGARLASNLSHPHITVVHDYGQTSSGGLFLVMELLEGVSMHQALKVEGAMEPERVLRIGEQVLRALDHAHRKHIVHRDLKPGNLFMLSGQSAAQGEAGDFVKVLDFGIAKAFESEGGAEGDELDDSGDVAMQKLSSEVTHQRQVCGTPHYMAPEQVAMGRIDARTDLYSLGVVMYRMLAARLPFDGKETHELFRMHLAEPPMPFAVARPDLDIPAPIEAVIMRALAKDPDHRFANAAEMRVALREVRRGLGLLSEEDSFNGPPSLQGGVMPSGRTAAGPRPLPSLAPPPVTIELPVPARSRRGAVVFFALSATAVALILGLWISQRPDASAPAQPLSTSVVSAPRSTEAAPDVAVEIESTPVGARVRTTLRALGETPLRVTLPRDTQTLFLELPDHQSKELTLNLRTVGNDERVKYQVTLEKAVAPAPPSEPPAPETRPSTARPAPRPAPAAAPEMPATVAPSPSAPATRAPKTPAQPDHEGLLDVDPAAERPGKRPNAPATAKAVELLE